MNSILLLALVLSAATSHAADPRDQAAWMLNRLTGVRNPGDSVVIDQMAALIKDGKPRDAAAIATGQQQFLTVTVREMAAKMSTREETVREPLNDFVASFIGVTRDDSDARELLFGDFFYRADPAKAPGVGQVVVRDLLTSNNHYEQLEQMNLNWADALVRVGGQQIANSDQSAIPSPDPAGILTSHAFLGAHAIAGTNRRLVEYSFREFMCTPLVGWADTSAPDLRIGRDIDRQPGGDPVKFQTTCKGCHTGMDGFRGAFAKYDYVDNVGGGDRKGAIIHAANGGGGNYRPNLDQRGVMYKMNRDNVIQYAGGYVSTDDSFMNNATRGANGTMFGWRGYAPDSSALATRTSGVHAYGRLLANSQQFGRCMAKRAFDVVCKHDLDDSVADALYESLRLDFENNGYSMKKLFQAVAVNSQCRI